MLRQFGNNSAPDNLHLFSDPTDPIDMHVLEFKQAVTYDNYPTLAEQKHLIAAIQHESPEAAKAAEDELVTSHRGLIAAILYPEKTPDTDSSQLLLTGEAAFRKAAETYPLTEPEDFSDYAVRAVRKALDRDDTEPAVEAGDEPEYRPMETIYQFAEAFNKKQLRRIKKLLTPDEYKVMSVLHLTDGEASERTGIAPANIPYFMKRAWDKLGTENRLSTALYLLKHGMKFDIERPADDVRFTLRERDVADRLELRNQDIAHDLDLSLDQVKATITSLRSKTGAKTRTELALISHMFPLKLAEEEAKLPEILREFTPRQREVLQRLHLGLEEIAHQLDISPQAVRHLVDRVKDKTGHTNTVELALELQRNGVRYAIRKPKQPLVELWDSRDMEIVSSLGPPNKDIAESLDLPPQEVRDRIAEMQVKTRARTKVELALIMAAFDTGERRAPEPRPGDIELSPRDKLAAKLGYKTLSTAEVSLLLQQVRPRERRALAMYHDRDEPITWREASEQLEIEGYSTARSAASAGIARIRRLGIRLVAQAESPGQEPDEDEPLLAQAA